MILFIKKYKIYIGIFLRIFFFFSFLFINRYLFNALLNPKHKFLWSNLGYFNFLLAERKIFYFPLACFVHFFLMGWYVWTLDRDNVEHRLRCEICHCQWLFSPTLPSGPGVVLFILGKIGFQGEWLKIPAGHVLLHLKFKQTRKRKRIPEILLLKNAKIE